jgi:hypothetical protein
MGSTADMKLIVVWEGELRIAAKAIKEFRLACADGNEDRINRTANVALQACGVALEGCEDESAAIVITRTPDPESKRRTRRT